VQIADFAGACEIEKFGERFALGSGAGRPAATYRCSDESRRNGACLKALVETKAVPNVPVVQPLALFKSFRDHGSRRCRALTATFSPGHVWHITHRNPPDLAEFIFVKSSLFPFNLFPFTFCWTFTLREEGEPYKYVVAGKNDALRLESVPF
jgi:hypothetical protein